MISVWSAMIILAEDGVLRLDGPASSCPSPTLSIPPDDQLILVRVCQTVLSSTKPDRRGHGKWRNHLLVSEEADGEPD